MKTTTEPEKLDLTSHSIADDKREALLKLFPEARTEGGKLDLEKLKLALGEAVDTGRERYGMNWPGKADCFAAIQAPSMATLRPVPEESIAFDSTQNLIIEGDNLQVLKLLQKGYQGKVKMIYIDPPYNTGKDFIYPDNYSEELRTYLQYTKQVDDEGRKWGTNTDTDGRFHSKWLNMMYPRLYLARNLLREDGVIFISIDEHEISNLRSLCDELFGEENFIVQATVQSSSYVETTDAVKMNEFMVAYKKSTMFSLFGETQKTESRGTVGNPEQTMPVVEFPAGLRVVDVPDGVYRDTRKVGGNEDIELISEEIVVKGGQLAQPVKLKARWRNPNDMKAFFANGRQPIINKFKKKVIDVYFKGDRFMPYTVKESGEKFPSLLTGEIVKGINSKGSIEANQLMGFEAFDYPKHTALIKYLMSYVGHDDIVMDFFAGSGTTAHATLELNRDGGHRSFILVQLPEPTGRKDYPTIADLAKERVRRVAKKLEAKQTGSLQLEAAQDRGFRVYKLAESNFKPWNAQVPDANALGQQMQLHVHHVLEGRTEQDLFTEILLKSGFQLTTPVEQLALEGLPVYDVNGGELLVCLAQPLTHEALKAMAVRKPQRAVCLDAGFADNDQLKANAVQLFKGKGVVFKTV